MTKYPDIFAALAAPFGKEELKTRQQGGKTLTYVTARTVMNRLDEVLGPANWWDAYHPGENAVLCELTIRLPDGQLLTKCDIGGKAGMADDGDDEKSGASDALKRAAVKLGVGRYLYRDGVPTFVREREPAIEAATTATAPAPAAVVPPEPAASPATRNGGNGSPPRSGKALFAWTKEQEQRHEVGLLKYLNN